VASLVADEGPAFGAALLVGVGVGLFESVADACRSTVQVEERLEPRAETAGLYSELHNLYRSLYFELRGTFHDLHRLSGGD
jgi:xylulokinase